MDRLSASRFTSACLPALDAEVAATASPACDVMPPAARASTQTGDLSCQPPALDNVHCMARHKQASQEALATRAAQEQELHDERQDRFSFELMGPDGNRRTVDIMQYRTGFEFSFSDPALGVDMAPLHAANDREVFFASDTATNEFVSTPPPGDCP